MYIEVIFWEFWHTISYLNWVRFLWILGLLCMFLWDARHGNVKIDWKSSFWCKNFIFNVVYVSFVFWKIQNAIIRSFLIDFLWNLSLNLRVFWVVHSDVNGFFWNCSIWEKIKVKLVAICSFYQKNLFSYLIV